MLTEQGYETLFLGDFNAHVKISERFRFKQYPHPENNNGRLMRDFADRLDLQCLNPLEWSGEREDKITFQKQIGPRYVSSIIDYGLSSPGANKYVKSKVHSR